ncbi:MAG: biotin-dependent carboxyltransferase family protein [Robiginitalea sp.]|jgi:biotin-dependent carboxylase-like uncharacterized protein
MLKVLKPGFFTSIQDRGRFHYRHFGVPVSGAMDQIAFKRANALLENDPGAAALEITMQGPEVEFTEQTFMVLSGAPLDARLEGEPLEINRVYPVPAGAVLTCGHVLEGFRTYLSVKGGFLTEEKLGSRSQYFPVTSKSSVTKGAQLPYEPCDEFSPKLLKVSSRGYLKEQVLKVFPGPDFELLTEQQIHQIFEKDYSLSKEFDRMACQISPSIEGISTNVITSATLPGTVQLTPAGTLIILMRDGQTTGGYPRILQLDTPSLDLMGQKRFGDHIRFRRA